ncbi:winged helix-turn-helix domain-containing protein [Bordetella petrii]|uniref:winged helix-turn-helix domain-containing protein n=1 Tax=Bordetella petrii TaxID=94624 RepID=UPI00372E8751
MVVSPSSVPAPDHSLARVVFAHRSGSDGWWSLLYQGWVLVTPSGQRVNLTSTERACFLCLLASPQRELTRQALMQAVPQASLRTINVSISRLRKKVRAAGARLPLHTVHGMGYVFLGNLVAESASS